MGGPGQRLYELSSGQVHGFDLFGVYQSPEEIVIKPYHISKDKRNREFIYPAVVVIGKYV
jgi:hypothetical protein